MLKIKPLSDQLSLTLSLIAIVSAAITSYYQFFHHATEVSHFTSGVDEWPAVEGDVFQDSLSCTVTFLNSGSTPVAIVKSRLFLTSDTVFASHVFTNYAKDVDHQKNDPYKDPFNSIRKNRIHNTIHVDVNQEHLLKEQSVLSIKFSGALTDSTGFGALLKEAPLFFGSSESSGIRAGLWMLMADPYGDFSMMTIPLGLGMYDRERGSLPGELRLEKIETLTMPAFAEGSYWEKISWDHAIDG